MRMFDELRGELGFKIASPYGLKEKHARALVMYWHSKGLSASTLENRLCHLRVFATLALRKEGMIPSLQEYLPDVKRERTAARDKAVSAVADPKEIILRAMDYCPFVGMQLWMQWQFSLRMQEAIYLRPGKNDLGHELAVNEGTKGGRPRRVPITTPEQRAALNAAKALADRHPSGKITVPRKTLAQDKSHFYYVCSRIGLTRKGIGATAHGFRHDGLQAEFKARTGVDAPVKASAQSNAMSGENNPNDKTGGKTIAHISKAKLEQAQYAVSHLAGHNRKDAAGAYLGSISKARARAIAAEPLPEIDPHADSTPLNERMARMSAIHRSMQLARQELGPNNSREPQAAAPTPAAAFDEAPDVAHDVAPAAATERIIPVSAQGSVRAARPGADQVTSLVTHQAHNPAAAQPAEPQRTRKRILVEQPKLGLMSRLLGKKNSGEQPPQQSDLFAAPAPAPTSILPSGPTQPGDPAGTNAGNNIGGTPANASGLDENGYSPVDDRDPYAKPGDWE
jgi:integrase